MKKEALFLSTIGIVTLIIVVGAALLLGGKPTQQNSGEKINDTKLLVGTGEHAIGSSSAKVTVVEFADFQCPACASAQPVVKRIVEEYKDRIYYVFRHFPLPGHKNAFSAAKAAEAAGKQGKFFEMHDLLFNNQLDWAESNNPEELFRGYAQNLNLNMESFTTAFADASLAKNIQKDQDDALQLGVNSTPTFFINGEKYTGVISYENFKRIIDDKLK